MKNCDECISESVDCAWCEDISFSGTSRCIDKTLGSGFNCSSVIDPKTTVTPGSMHASNMLSETKKKTKKKKKNGKQRNRHPRDSPSEFFEPDEISIDIRALDTVDFDFKFTMPKVFKQFLGPNSKQDFLSKTTVLRHKLFF